MRTEVAFVVLQACVKHGELISISVRVEHFNRISTAICYLSIRHGALRRFNDHTTSMSNVAALHSIHILAICLCRCVVRVLRVVNAHTIAFGSFRALIKKFRL